MRVAKVIEATNKAGIAMVFTGMRHFDTKFLLDYIVMGGRLLVGLFICKSYELN